MDFSSLAAAFLTSLTTYLSASAPIDFTKSSLACLSVVESKVTFCVLAESPAAMTMLVTPSSLLNASRTCFLQPAHVTPVMVTVYTVFGAASAVLNPAKRASAASAMASAFMVLVWIAVLGDRRFQHFNDRSVCRRCNQGNPLARWQEKVGATRHPVTE